MVHRFHTWSVVQTGVPSILEKLTERVGPRSWQVWTFSAVDNTLGVGLTIHPFVGFG